MKFVRFEHGIVAVPLLDVDQIDEYRRQIWESLAQGPHLRTPGKVPQPPVLGAFGAMGCYNSFFTQPTMGLRTKAFNATHQFFANDYQGDAPIHIAAVFDRLCIRTGWDAKTGEAKKAGTQMPAKSKHRDTTRRVIANRTPDLKMQVIDHGLSEDATIVGGWINLDHEPQRFEYQHDTHRNVSTFGDGFSTMTESTGEKYDRFLVPPGFLLIFDQRLIHHIAKAPRPYRGTTVDTVSMRLYTAATLSTLPHALYSADSYMAIHTGTIPRLKGGAIPDNYAKLHTVNHREMLKAWSKRVFKDEYLDPDTGFVLNPLPPLKAPPLHLVPLNDIFMPRPLK